MSSRVAITVMHTGTWTLRDFYKKKGMSMTKIRFPKEVFSKYPEKYLRLNNRYLYGHPFDHHIAVMDVLIDRGCELVTTVRHPDDTAKSWSRRYELGYSRHKPITLVEQYEAWLEHVVPRASKIYRIEDFRERLHSYEGVDYNGAVPDISSVRDRVMEVWDESG